MGIVRILGARHCALGVAFGTAAAVAGAPVYAKSTATNTIPVALTVDSNCGLSTNPLQFGTVTSQQKTVSASTTMTVKCTPGTVYTVMIDNGKYFDGTDRRMWGGQSNGQVFYASYQLYQDATQKLPWGDTPQTAKGGVVPPSGQTLLTLYGVAQLKNARSGPYHDTVTVTLDF